MRVTRPNFEDSQLEDGTYAAVIVDVLDCGRPRGKSPKGEDKSPSPQLHVIFRLNETNSFGDLWEVRYNYPLTIAWGALAKFPGVVKAALGSDSVERIFDQGEFRPEWMIGKPVIVTITNKESGQAENKRMFPNVTAVAPPMKSQATIAHEDYVRQIDRAGYTPPVPSAFDDITDPVISTIPEFIGANGNAWGPWPEGYADKPRVWKKDVPMQLLQEWTPRTQPPGIRESNPPASSASDVLLQEAHHITPQEPVREGGRIAADSGMSPKEYARAVNRGDNLPPVRRPEPIPVAAGEVDDNDPFEGE